MNDIYYYKNIKLYDLKYCEYCIINKEYEFYVLDTKNS